MPNGGHQCLASEPPRTHPGCDSGQTMEAAQRRVRTELKLFGRGGFLGSLPRLVF